MKNIIQEYWRTKTKDEVKFQKSPFLLDKSFENKLFMDTPPIIGENMKNEKPRGGSLNHWVGGLMHITFQTCYDLQYIIMRISGYIIAPTEPDSISLNDGMEYHMNHQHEPIM